MVRLPAGAPGTSATCSSGGGDTRRLGEGATRRLVGSQPPKPRGGGRSTEHLIPGGVEARYMAQAKSDGELVTWNDAIRFWIIGGITLFLVAIVGNLILAAL